MQKSTNQSCSLCNVLLDSGKCPTCNWTPEHCPKCKPKVLLTGRHCLSCGWSRQREIFPKLAKSLGAPQAPLLFQLLRQYSITLPQNAIEWRVCLNLEKEIGISGQHILHGLVTQLLTDGIVCWFLLGDHETLFFGHESNFEPANDQIERPARKHSSKPITDPRLIALAMED